MRPRCCNDGCQVRHFLETDTRRKPTCLAVVSVLLTSSILVVCPPPIISSAERRQAGILGVTFHCLSPEARVLVTRVCVLFAGALWAPGRPFPTVTGMRVYHPVYKDFKFRAPRKIGLIAKICIFLVEENITEGLMTEHGGDG